MKKSNQEALMARINLIAERVNMLEAQGRGDEATAWLLRKHHAELLGQLEEK